jgi:DNA (cytosine-5)-methyltransferase 1
MKISLLSFFSGSGFLDLGFEDEGFSVDFVNELHQPFREAYQYSRTQLGKNPPQYGYSNDDVVEFLSAKKSMLFSIMCHARVSSDLVGFIGGPPCPDFSIGGKNRGSEGDRGQLSATYIDLIIQRKPHFFLFENVKGLWRTKKHRTFYEELKQKLQQANYLLTERVVNSIEYGVPQDRERVFLIGFRNSTLADLNKVEEFNHNFPWLTQTQYSTDILKANWPNTHPFEENNERIPEQNTPMELTVEHWFNRNNIIGHPNAEHYFQPRAGLSKFLSIDEGDVSGKSYKRLHRWRYSPTAAYGNNEVHIHPYKPRRISAAEALAIQSLPEGFVLPHDMTLTNMFKTIGNGVPYLASRGIAKTLIQFVGINSYGKNHPGGFSSSHQKFEGIYERTAALSG